MIPLVNDLSCAFEFVFLCVNVSDEFLKMPLCFDLCIPLYSGGGVLSASWDIGGFAQIGFATNAASCDLTQTNSSSRKNVVNWISHKCSQMLKNPTPKT